MVGVSRKSVSVWKKEGRVVTVGNLVDVEDSRAALQKFTSSRSRAYASVMAMRWAGNTEPPEGNKAEPDLPRLPGGVVNLSIAAKCWAEDAAIAMLRHLPEPTVKAIHANLLDSFWKEAADLCDEDVPPADGFVAWASHPKFIAPIKTDWNELKALAWDTS